MADIITAPHWKDVAWDHTRWPNFVPKEMAQRGDGWHEGRTPITYSESFMDRLQKLRELMEVPLVITSGYRSPVYNNKVSTTGLAGPHTTGRAVDIKIYGENVGLLITMAVGLGFTGVGVKQHGDYHKRYIHLDDLSSHETAGPRPWLWSYP